jgi:hypothetical protein
MAAQHFFVGGKYLGTRQIPDNRVMPGMDIKRYDSQVFYCLLCGEIWGRIIHEKAPYNQITCRQCSSHGDGRLSDDWMPPEYNRTRFEEDWPPDAVKYEFEQQLKWHTKELK